ncbi:MAG TPA: glycoside hydrolase family 44 protein, partial [Usitatibacter sp.]|nr:glycoside hydrolase family 44 protein [Usitatibacter sp.]
MPRTAARRLAAIAALCLSCPLHAANPAASITVDALANRRAIDPRIYGLAFATAAQLDELNAPLNRSGGNATSQYNWQANASNRGADWYFESLPSDSASAGGDGDSFISGTLAGHSSPMLTIPTIGWVARLGASRGRLSSFSIAKYGAQQDNDW